jgi:hypothetical protein
VVATCNIKCICAFDAVDLDLKYGASLIDRASQIQFADPSMKLNASQLAWHNHTGPSLIEQIATFARVNPAHPSAACGRR